MLHVTYLLHTQNRIKSCTPRILAQTGYFLTDLLITVTFDPAYKIKIVYKISKYLGINEYECICDPGWGGFSCDENMVWFLLKTFRISLLFILRKSKKPLKDECNPNPCLNDANCTGIFYVQHRIEL